MKNYILKLTVNYHKDVPQSTHYFNFEDLENNDYRLNLITGINTGAMFNTTFNFPEFSDEAFNDHSYRSTLANEAFRMLRRASLLRQASTVDASCEFIPANPTAETSILLI